MNATTKLCCLGLMALLAACGGGGGDNRPPTASGITIATNEDQSGSGSISASDLDNDALSAAIGAAPTKGVATVSGSNPFSVAYTPNANQNGADSFAVVVADTHGARTTVTVSINITPQPDDPLLNAQSFTVAEDAPLDGNVTASDPDGDSLTFSVTLAPGHGALSLTPAGAFTYVPGANYNGADTFAVQVSDGARISAATMNLTVTSVNDPVVVRGEYAVFTDQSGLVNVLANESDDDGDPLTVTIESQPPGATAAVEANQIRVTAGPTMAGPTSMTYRVSDGAGGSAVGTLGLLFGPSRPFFYTTGAPNSAQRRIRFSNYFVNFELDTPIPSGETFARFATSANGRWVVYVTRDPSARHRLWLRDAWTPANPVVEIPTGEPGFFTRYLSLSPDGTLVAFNGRVASTATPGVSQALDFVGIGIERPLFTRDSRQVYYTVLLNGGGRVIKRADVTETGVVSNRVQITADYPSAQGLGIDFTLSPDETWIVSLGLIMPVGGGPTASIQQHAFVTPVDGSMMDSRLHPLPTPPLEGAYSVPVVSQDSRHAVYSAALNGGVSGQYSTDLDSPGTAILIAAGADQPTFGGNAPTMFYSQTPSGPNSVTWYRASAAAAGSGVAFAPVSGAPPPRILLAARDASAVVFDAGSQVYMTLENQFANPTLLLALPAGDTVGRLKYANDWNSVLVFGASRNNATLINPRAPGWSAPLLPLPDFTSGVSSTCVAFAGESC